MNTATQLHRQAMMIKTKPETRKEFLLRRLAQARGLGLVQLENRVQRELEAIR